jgi:hypothetical protein
MDESNCDHIRPRRGGDPQGRRDSNSRHAVLEAAVLPLNYVPIEMETAPRDFPGAAAFVCLRWRYPAAVLMLRAALSCEDGFM